MLTALRDANANAHDIAYTNGDTLQDATRPGRGYVYAVVAMILAVSSAWIQNSARERNLICFTE